MRFLLVVLLFLFSGTGSVAAPLNARYELTTLEPEIRYVLELNNGDYTLIANHYFRGGNVAEVYLSCGKFIRKGKRIELIDAIHQFRMSYFLANDCLKPEKTFGPLKEKFFIKIKANRDKSRPCDYQDNAIAKKKRLYNTRTNTSYHTWHLGKYTNNGYTLELLAKNRFRYSYFDGVILSGEFRRKNNELQLRDLSLNHVSYFFIHENMMDNGFHNAGGMLLLVASHPVRIGT